MSSRNSAMRAAGSLAEAPSCRPAPPLAAIFFPPVTTLLFSMFAARILAGRRRKKEAAGSGPRLGRARGRWAGGRLEADGDAGRRQVGLRLDGRELAFGAGEDAGDAHRQRHGLR